MAGNNFYTIVNTVLDVAKKHKLIEEVYYGDIYEFENQPSRKFNNFVLTIQSTTEGEDITTYSFNAFVTDRLTDDKSNLIEVQSLSKTILSQILKECFENIGDITYTFWTEKFNDLCAGCYASFSVSVPNELICADDSLFDVRTLKIDSNGTYSVVNFDEVRVDVLSTSEEKTINIDKNGTYIVTPEDVDFLSKVTVIVKLENSYEKTDTCLVVDPTPVVNINNTDGSYWEVEAAGYIGTSLGAFLYAQGEKFGAGSTASGNKLFVCYNGSYIPTSDPYTTPITYFYEDSNGKYKINNYTGQFTATKINATTYLGSITRTDQYVGVNYIKVYKNKELILDLEPYIETNLNGYNYYILKDEISNTVFYKNNNPII